MRNATVIEGGCLTGKVWYARTLEVPTDEGSFLQFNKNDRDFARAIGCNMQMRWPFEGYNFIEHLQKCRNDAIDQLLAEHKFKDDPLADQSDITIASAGRAALYKGAEVPFDISVTHPAFRVDFLRESYRMVPEHTFKSLSCSRKNTTMSMELTEGNLEWLLDVAAVQWPGIPIKQQVHDDLPPLTKLNVAWIRRGSNHYITCRYGCQDGSYRSHRQAVSCIGHDDFEFVTSVVRFTESEVQDFYDAHNVELDTQEYMPESADD